MYFYHTIILLYSITKQQQHVYDYIPTKSLSPSSNDDNIVMDVNPAYGDFTKNTIKTDENMDREYEAVDTQTRRVKTDDVKIVTNPAYAETKFN